MKKLILISVILLLTVVAKVSAVSANGSLKVSALNLNGGKLCVVLKTTSGTTMFGYLTTNNPNFAFYHTELCLALKEGFYTSIYWDDSLPLTDWGINNAYAGKWIKAIAVSNVK